MNTDTRSLPIGVFDSGIGGLTVLKALSETLPNESFVYLGDTARLPYGTKSAKSVTRYALQTSALLRARGVKLLVIACNTATAVSLDALQDAYPDLPVVGVIQPGALAACRTSVNGRIGVIGTESTINGGSYEREILRIRPEARVFGLPCPLFVPLAEEGWCAGEIAELVARRYLERLGVETGIDTLVLGCTHFPVLSGAIGAVMGPGVALVDSARTTAEFVREMLERRKICAPSSSRTLTFLATDGAERFARVGGLFMHSPLRPDDVEIVDL
ncbi:MAG: glutamate racemase [Deltaproteobacteria bacterium]|nr:glutamate racemase [Deltaproteobacteria bacterium]